MSKEPGEDPSTSKYEIKVVPYDPNWPFQFETEAEKIEKALGDNFIAIHHVGSTAVPGLLAKPRIDIMIVVRERRPSIIQLESIGYEYRGGFNIPFHYGFRKRGEVEFNLHVYEEDHPDVELLITFRDYLRQHPSARDDYVNIKQELLEMQASFEKNNSIYTGYTLGKNNYICKVLDDAGFDRLRLMKCTHHTEWEAAKYLRDKYFFGPRGIDDTYTWTFNHNSHVHFIFYQGTKIIGYTHIQLWQDARAAIRIIVIDEAYRKHGFGTKFLALVEKWLKEEEYTSVHTESTFESRLFYEKQGYTAMPLNDPDGHASNPNDIPFGKIL